MSGEIVVGYDDSEGARVALTTAIDLARRLDVALILVFCTEPPAATAGGAGDQRDVIAEIGKEQLAHGLALTDAAGVRSSAELVTGRPTEGLIAAADEHDAAMVVVGHHGEGPLRGALLGATANKLLHLSDRPVLVVPAPEQSG